MNNLMKQLINDEVEKDMKSNEEVILKSLVSGLKYDTDLSPETGVMCMNAIKISTTLTLTKIFAFLEDSGLVHLDEDELRRSLIKPL